MQRTFLGVHGHILRMMPIVVMLFVSVGGRESVLDGGQDGLSWAKQDAGRP